MQKNITKIRFTTLNNELEKVSAIATFENNKMVSFAAEKGTVRNLETINIYDDFERLAKRFGVEKDFEL